MGEDTGRTPRDLGGGVYCSPRCGYKCTRVGHDRALNEARMMASRLGEGWEGSVWENCGWHAQAKKGVARVTQRVTGSKIAATYTVIGYTAWIEGSKQFIADAETPEDAFGFAVQDARTFTRRVEQELADLLEVS
jgi:hypothetical protein